MRTVINREIVSLLAVLVPVLAAIWVMNQGLRTELKEGLGQVRVEIQQVRAELKTDINQLRTELKEEINDLRQDVTSLSERVSRLEGTMAVIKDAFLGRNAVSENLL